MKKTLIIGWIAALAIWLSFMYIKNNQIDLWWIDFKTQSTVVNGLTFDKFMGTNFFNPTASDLSTLNPYRVLRSYTTPTVFLGYSKEWSNPPFANGLQEMKYEPGYAFGGVNHDTNLTNLKNAGHYNIMTMVGTPYFLIKDTNVGCKDYFMCQSVPLMWWIQSGKNPNDPENYKEFCSMRKQIAARYGRNKDFPLSEVTLAPGQTKKVWLGLVDAIEFHNEPNKWWNPNWSTDENIPLAYVSAYTAKCAQMVKEVDPSMKVYFPALSIEDTNKPIFKPVKDWADQYNNGKVPAVDGVALNIYWSFSPFWQLINGTIGHAAYPEQKNPKDNLSYREYVEKVINEAKTVFGNSTYVNVTEFGRDSSIDPTNHSNIMRVKDIPWKNPEHTQADRTVRWFLALSAAWANMAVNYRAMNDDWVQSPWTPGLYQTCWDKNPSWSITKAKNYVNKWLSQILAWYRLKKIQEWATMFAYTFSHPTKADIVAMWSPTAEWKTFEFDMKGLKGTVLGLKYFFNPGEQAYSEKPIWTTVTIGELPVFITTETDFEPDIPAVTTNTNTSTNNPTNPPANNPTTPAMDNSPSSTLIQWWSCQSESDCSDANICTSDVCNNGVCSFRPKCAADKQCVSQWGGAWISCETPAPGTTPTNNQNNQIINNPSATTTCAPSAVTCNGPSRPWAYCCDSDAMNNKWKWLGSAEQCYGSAWKPADTCIPEVPLMPAPNNQNSNAGTTNNPIQPTPAPWIPAGVTPSLWLSCESVGNDIIVAFVWQSNAAGEWEGSIISTEPKSLPEAMAGEYKSKTNSIVAYDESDGIGEREVNVNGATVWLSVSKLHSPLYELAKVLYAKTKRRIITVPSYRSATAITSEWAAWLWVPYWLDPSWKGLSAVVDRIQKAKALAKWDADVIALIYATEYEIFALQNGWLTKENYKKQLKQLVDKLITEAGVEKVFVSTMHRLNKDGGFANGTNLAHEWWVELAQEYPEKLAVVYDGRLMNDPMYHYSSDYIHINAAGMDKLGKESALGIANALGCK